MTWWQIECRAPSSLCCFLESLCLSSPATACGPEAFQVIPIPLFFYTNHAPGNISCHMTSFFFLFYRRLWHYRCVWLCFWFFISLNLQLDCFCCCCCWFKACRQQFAHKMNSGSWDNNLVVIAGKTYCFIQTDFMHRVLANANTGSLQWADGYGLQVWHLIDTQIFNMECWTFRGSNCVDCGLYELVWEIHYFFFYQGFSPGVQLLLL